MVMNGSKAVDKGGDAVGFVVGDWNVGEEVLFVAAAAVGAMVVVVGTNDAVGVSEAVERLVEAGEGENDENARVGAAVEFAVEAFV
jgi:hypothetical protein